MWKENLQQNPLWLETCEEQNLWLSSTVCEALFHAVFFLAEILVEQSIHCGWQTNIICWADKHYVLGRHTLFSKQTNIICNHLLLVFMCRFSDKSPIIHYLLRIVEPQYENFVMLINHSDKIAITQYFLTCSWAVSRKNLLYWSIKHRLRSWNTATVFLLHQFPLAPSAFIVYPVRM